MGFAVLEEIAQTGKGPKWILQGQSAASSIVPGKRFRITERESER
jgi:hypothetical protein